MRTIRTFAIVLLLMCAACSTGQKRPLMDVRKLSLMELPAQDYGQIGLGVVRDTRYSPDGRILAVGTSIGVILYDAGTLELIRRIPADDAEKLSWSPSGRFLAVSELSSMFVYDLRANKKFRLDHAGDLDIHSSDQIAWSPDENYIAATTLLMYTAHAWVWDLATRTRVYDLSLPDQFGEYKYASGVNWSGDGHNIAVSFRVSGSNGEAGVLAVWDISGTLARLSHQWAVPGYQVKDNPVRLPSSGRLYWILGDRFILILSDQNISVVQASDGTTIEQKTTDGPIIDASIPLGDLLRVSSGQKSLTILDFKLPMLDEVAQTNYPASPFCTPQQEQTNGCDFEMASLAPNKGPIAASNSFHDRIFIFDPHGLGITNSIFLNSHWNRDLSFSPDSRYLAALGQDGIVRSYNTESLEAVDTIDAADDLFWLDAGKLAGYDSQDTRGLLQLDGLFQSQASLVSPDGKLRADLGEDTKAECNFLVCLPASKYQLTIRTVGANLPWYSLELRDTSMELQWSPDGRWLMTTGSLDGQGDPAPYGIILIGVAQPNKTYLLSEVGAVEGIAWSGDGRYFAATGASGVIRLFRTEQTLAAFEANN